MLMCLLTISAFKIISLLNIQVDYPTYYKIMSVVEILEIILQGGILCSGQRKN